ncbi:MAG: helix-turn-helix transcriptional regulator [Pseudomonadota bacterium]
MDEHERPQDRTGALTLLRTAMAVKKMTQASLAEEAACHEKTIQNLLAGRAVRDQTLFDVCAVLGVEFQTVKDAWSGTVVSGPMELRGDGGLVAPVYMGAYTRAAVDHYIGTFVTIRPAFGVPDTLISYVTRIVWDPDWPSLVFEELDRPDAKYQHRGRVYVPTSSPFIHLVSLTKGAMRMIMLSQVDASGTMHGLIQTLHRKGAMLVPVSAPIVYLRKDGGGREGEDGQTSADTKSDLPAALYLTGQFRDGMAGYREKAQLLRSCLDEGYARLVAAP